LKSISRRRVNHEEDVSAKQQEAQKNSWLSGQNGNQGRPAGIEEPAGKRPEKAEREWIETRARSFPGGRG